jgi:nucleoside-diphosphate-sugar epimerase
MKVLLAGATGAIGQPLTRQLQEAGHDVIGLTRTAGGATALSAAGVVPVVADAMDRSALLKELEGLRADAVIHELTALRKPPARHSGMAQTDRLRTVGTENLLIAARQVGATRFLTQSIVLGYGYTDHQDRILGEQAPFGQPDSGRSNPHVKAMQRNEHLVRKAGDLEGIALRYGLFYGADVEVVRRLLAQRRLPIPAKVDNPIPWVHIEDAAAATVAALEHGRAGAAYNVVDDDTTSWGRLFTDMAAVLGTPAPRRMPSWLIRAAAPYVAAMILDTSMRVSNDKAKSELHWSPRYPTHLDGLESLASGHAA